MTLPTDLLAIDCIAVPRQIAGRRLEGESLYQLPRSPLGRRALSDIEVQHAAAPMAQDDQNEILGRRAFLCS
jgi:hypothetical protein